MLLVTAFSQLLSYLWRTKEKRKKLDSRSHLARVKARSNLSSSIWPAAPTERTPTCGPRPASFHKGLAAFFCITTRQVLLPQWLRSTWHGTRPCFSLISSVCVMVEGQSSWSVSLRDYAAHHRHLFYRILTRGSYHLPILLTRTSSTLLSLPLEHFIFPWNLREISLSAS